MRNFFIDEGSRSFVAVADILSCVLSLSMFATYQPVLSQHLTIDILCSCSIRAERCGTISILSRCCLKARPPSETIGCWLSS